MNSEILQKVDFTLHCIDDFATRHALNHKQAFAYLKRFKGLDYLESEISKSNDPTILEQICRQNGGAL